MKSKQEKVELAKYLIKELKKNGKFRHVYREMFGETAQPILRPMSHLTGRRRLVDVWSRQHHA